MSKRDYYEVLGIDKNASFDEIKMAYKKLARQYHPDVAVEKERAEILFREINEAYAVLSDNEKKSQYDRFGHAGFDGGRVDFDPFSIFSDVFDGFFGGGFGGGRRSGRRQPEGGADLRYDLKLTLEEVYKGVSKDISITTYIVCGKCNGSGLTSSSIILNCDTCKGHGQVRSVQQSFLGQIIRNYPCPDCEGLGTKVKNPCPDCNGTGRVYSQKNITVKIPPGVDNDSRLRLSGQGEAGLQGALSGDLYIFFEILPNDIFERHDINLYIEKNITFTTAALGGEIEIPTMEKPTKLKITAGTQGQTVIKVKGAGMPHLNGKNKGDLYVKLIVMIPTQLNEKQKELLRQFAAAGSQEAEKSFIDKVKEMFS